MPAANGDRPLTARNVLASALLGVDPPEAAVADLIRLAALFAVSENRTRVALSRMVAAGEASTDGGGRYRLEGPLLARQARQQISRRGASTPWDGTWTVVVAIGTLPSGAARRTRRETMTRARLAPLREGVWIRPANLASDLPEPIARDLLVMTATLDQLPGTAPNPDGRDLAARLWDLDGWSDTARDLLHRLRTSPPDGTGNLAAGFVLSASVLRHLQADPLLPPTLLPAAWPGARLRETYDEWDSRYRAQLSVWNREARTGGNR